jgi:hypothetical protein
MFIIVDKMIDWSEMTLNYQMMVERDPNLKEEVGSSDRGDFWT